MIDDKIKHIILARNHFYSKHNIWKRISSWLKRSSIILIIITALSIALEEQWIPCGYTLSIFNDAYWEPYALPLLTTLIISLNIYVDYKISTYKLITAKCHEKYDSKEFAIAKSEMMDYYEINEDKLKGLFSDTSEVPDDYTDYSLIIKDNVPIHLYGLIAIKTNVDYHQLLLSDYLNKVRNDVFRVSLFTIFAIILCTILFDALYLQILYAFLPLVQSYSTNVLRQIRHQHKSIQIDKYLDSVFKKILNNELKEPEVLLITRRVQDEVFRDRVEALYVPEKYYKYWSELHPNTYDSIAKGYVDTLKNHSII